MGVICQTRLGVYRTGEGAVAELECGKAWLLGNSPTRANIEKGRKPIVKFTDIWKIPLFRKLQWNSVALISVWRYGERTETYVSINSYTSLLRRRTKAYVRHMEAWGRSLCLRTSSQERSVSPYNPHAFVRWLVLPMKLYLSLTES